MVQMRKGVCQSSMQTLSRLIREAVIIRNIEVWKCLQHQMTVLATVFGIFARSLQGRPYGGARKPFVQKELNQIS